MTPTGKAFIARTTAGVLKGGLGTWALESGRSPFIPPACIPTEEIMGQR
jgi:hypothetical protein